MKTTANNFISLANIAVADTRQHEAVAIGTTNASHKRVQAIFRFGEEHGEALRHAAAQRKKYALQNLPELLTQAEEVMRSKGIEVFWAENGETANLHVLNIAQKHRVRNIVKSKSMVTEEIELNPALEEAGFHVLETDLGEYILQLNHEAPSHIVTPIIHKSKSSVRDLLVEKLGMPFTDDAREMTEYVRGVLRKEFFTADMGITGANFLVAETGSVCLVTNEGNGRMVSTLPPVHVVIVGIEKVVATLEDYALLTQLLPRSATGQLMTCYMQVINGPKKADESDGPEHVYVILVDNKRSEIYNSKFQDALNCIRCGACLNICPVYRATSGHAYGSVYPGPIGAVVTPLLTSLEEATLLPHASSLCGACLEVCPVKIDIPSMLLDLRSDLVDYHYSSTFWNWLMQAWRLVNQFPLVFNFVARLSHLLNPFLSWKLPPPLNGWTKYRRFPKFASSSFRQQWIDREDSKID